MGLEIDDYLFQCIVEGHKVLKRRMDDDLELPPVLRRGPRRN